MSQQVPVPLGMLRDDEKSLIRKSMEALRNGLDGFTPRRAQLEMMSEIASRLGAVCAGGGKAALEERDSQVMDF